MTTDFELKMSGIICIEMNVAAMSVVWTDVIICLLCGYEFAVKQFENE